MNKNNLGKYKISKFFEMKVKKSKEIYKIYKNIKKNGEKSGKSMNFNINRYA